MSNLIGAYLYFDDMFAQDIRDYRKPILTSGRDDPFTEFMRNKHPKWWWIIKQAGRENYFYNDREHSYTMFVIDENCFTTTDLINYDVDYCLRLFNQFVIQGDITKNILATSKYQQLTTLKQGYPLLIESGIIVQEQFVITESDIKFENVRIHIISRLP